jgi:IS30 family transposase
MMTEKYERRVFFCNPASSNQKANVENMNAQLRPIFPKHAILNEYTQKELCEAASMMNSRMLNSIDDKTPYELFAAIFGVGAAEALHIRKIAPKEVTLKPIHK